MTPPRTFPAGHTLPAVPERLDLFAAAALQGLLASGQHRGQQPDAVARHAWAYAEAMCTQKRAPLTGARP
jgi:hypothetical protein